MTEQQHALSLDARLKAEDELFHELLNRTDDRKFFWIAIGLAIVVHAAVFIVRFPEMNTIVNTKEKQVLVVKKYQPPPPPVEWQTSARGSRSAR